MPSNCFVPMCYSLSNKGSGLMFHKFPKDEDMIKKWLTAIRSGKKPTKYTKICSRHFLSSDYETTVLGWKMLKYSTAVPSQNLPEQSFGKLFRAPRRNIIPQLDNSTMASSNDKSSDESDVLHRNSSVDMCVQTIFSLKRSQLISHCFLNNAQLKHMTGLSRQLFIFFAENFGASYFKANAALTVEDELLLTLMKYRLNMSDTTLANFFDVPERVAFAIISAWTKHMSLCLHKIDFWKLRHIDKGEYDVVIDCTEFEIERSCDPVVQHATYSNCNETNTFKVLIGGTEKGMVCFVSDVYGGSISDHQIIEKSGLINHLSEGEYVLAEKGFDISDLLAAKGVILNIIPCKKSEQLNEKKITAINANRHIIIKNLIDLARNNIILSERISYKYWHIINEIIYNCFMLINFKKRIIR